MMIEFIEIKKSHIISNAEKVFDLEVEKDHSFIITDSNGMTNVKNVYACGDVIKKNVYQLTTAVSEGTIVAYSIMKSIKN